MSALRFCALAIFAVAMVAADGHMYSGNPGACGTMPTAGELFGNASIKCAKAEECQKTFCACIGAAAPTNFTCGAFTSGMPNCSTASMCIGAKMACINAAADDVAAGCTYLKDLKMSNLAVAGGQLYNASTAFMACKHEACMLLNKTAMGGNCSMDFDKLCASPVKFTGSMLLKGNWAAFLADATKKATLTTSLEADLTRALGVAIKIIKLFIRNNRRRQASQNLVVEFQASGVSGNNADLKARLATLESSKSTDFLTSTKAAYEAVNGAGAWAADVKFVGIAAGSSSSAVFTSASGTGSGSSTTTTSTTTGSATTTTTGSATTGTTTGGSQSGSTSGAATQSLLAAVAVAIVGALLF